MMAAAATKVLESGAASRPRDPLLTVFERHEDGGAFGGLRIAEPPS
ncbi:MAG: hypothetical protein M3R38_26780 [Actinomycetota bacterium]|nr:hypothetical protein [Actinomycetota bacterium]